MNTPDSLIEAMNDRTRMAEAVELARRCNDVSWVPALTARIRVEKNLNLRRWAIFLLRRIGVNSADPSVARALLEQLGREQSKKGLSEVLEALAEQPAIPDAGPLIPFTSDDRWAVRWPAIEALGRCPDAAAEKRLAELAERGTDPDDRIHAFSALGAKGSIAGVLAAENVLKAPARGKGVQDLRGAASFYLERLKRGSQAG